MIPTQKENPKGLYQRYTISKTDGSPMDPNADSRNRRAEDSSGADVAVCIARQRIP